MSREANSENVEIFCRPCYESASVVHGNFQAAKLKLFLGVVYGCMVW